MTCHDWLDVLSAEWLQMRADQAEVSLAQYTQDFVEPAGSGSLACVKLVDIVLTLASNGLTGNVGTLASLALRFCRAPI